MEAGLGLALTLLVIPLLFVYAVRRFFTAKGRLRQWDHQHNSLFNERFWTWLLPSGGRGWTVYSLINGCVLFALIAGLAFILIASIVG